MFINNTRFRSIYDDWLIISDNSSYAILIYILGLTIMLGPTRFSLSQGVEGLILGLLFSIKNMCFRETFIEIYKNEVAKKQ